ncbi:ANTAR domain-containing protein [Streptomyces sp. ID05-04B]|uniref:ANTAR domain-containing protein n=1 Tax=unclassified Streptomyces TaxID=2593676 RepID=UPI000D199350|nr:MULTISPECIES: ANTAR domain-containing protein [unclassified Streptomyces]AVV47006.1 ANTAR domain-containing protein [Streptomyces sp. P3]MDX5567635.1 ANTAR domain-containing protein [Streptomyces sp. ID05-04B]
MPENDELVRRVAALEQEVEQLRQALTSHAVIDQAIGVVAAVCRLPSQESWDVLKQVSQHTNIKLREVAHLVLRWVECGRLPDEIRPVMRAAVVRTRERSGAVGAPGESGPSAPEQPCARPGRAVAPADPGRL